MSHGREPEGPKEEPLAEAARLRAERARQDSEISVARRLGQIGVLGWLVVAPTLGGLFLGRWVDRWLGTGLLFTAPLLMVGLVLGCWIGWRWMKES